LHRISHRYLHKYLMPLLKSLPYKFLSPWIKYTSDKEVAEKSNSNTYNGPYALHDDIIIMDEDWFDYILDNYDELYKFGKESLVTFLKQHNSAFSLIRFIAS